MIGAVLLKQQSIIYSKHYFKIDIIYPCMSYTLMFYCPQFYPVIGPNHEK